MLLLDEPLAALDLKLRHAMQAELKSIQREVGITFLFVTHDQDEALSMSDRVAIMNGGVIEQCGTPEDVYENPTSVFAAAFIGTSNLMRGSTPAAPWPSPDSRSRPRAHRLGHGDQVSVAIRPEKIWMSDFTAEMVDARHDRLDELPRVDDAVPRLVGTGVTLTVLEQNLPRMRADNRWEPGDRVQIGWHPEHAVVLK